MESKRAPTALRRAQSVLAIALLVTLPALGHAGITLVIDGAAYPAQLRENTKLLNRLNAARTVRARHFEGELNGVDDSWIRASIIRGRWQGVVSLDGARFVIDSNARPANGGELVLDAQSPKTLLTRERCAADDLPAIASPALASPEIGVLSLASTLSVEPEPANFAVVCQTTISGVCLLAELDIVFDQQFQQRYPSTYQDQAAALLNIVDGYFRNDMRIQFDVLSMNFPATELFSTSLDATDLLTDITTKKNSGQIPFITNSRAIFHVVTGRRFNSSTVGLANTGTLCAAMSNTGTTQIVSNSTPLTALVVAHEIGHNFGASHDATSNNVCSTGFIMAATLSQSATHFSSCSIDEMTAKINTLSNLGACFEYPVDAMLVARPGNPTSARANENFALSYDVSETHASVAAAELTVTGSFVGGTGTFMAANVNGMGCAVAANAQTYTCVVGNSGGLLEVTARVNASAPLIVTSRVAASTTGSVKEFNTLNDSVSLSVTAGTPPTAPSSLAATAGTSRIDLTWQDNSNNENGFRVERRNGAMPWTEIATTAANATKFTDSSTLSGGVMYEYHVASFGAGGTSSPSQPANAQLPAASVTSGGRAGGGGGSFGFELAPLLLALLALRGRRKPI